MLKLFKRKKKDKKTEEEWKKEYDKKIKIKDFVLDQLYTLQEDGIILTVNGTRRCLEGDPEALCDVGLLYMEVEIYSKAMKWFLKATDHAPALREIGFLYIKGLGVEVNGAAALEFFKRAVNKGNDEALVDIGMIYLQGYGLPTTDKQKALEYFKMAAEKGSATGLYNIGYMYESGTGVAQDYNKAMEWYLKAADKGDMVACNNIGIMYKNGFGVPQNVHTAMKWYKKAAENGVAIAQFNLANTYEFTEEVRDLNEADYWYRLARNNGFVLPQEVLNQAQQIHDGAGNKENPKIVYTIPNTMNTSKEFDNFTFYVDSSQEKKTPVEKKAINPNEATTSIQQSQLSADFENKLNITRQDQAEIVASQVEKQERMNRLEKTIQQAERSRSYAVTNSHNRDFNYDSPNDDSDHENDINYDSS